MANPITEQQLINASMDANTLEQFVNSDQYVDIVSRLGRVYPSLAKAINSVLSVNFTLPLAGAVSRQITDKFTDSLSVADFGAVGNGVTDDTLAIRKAITAAGVNGVLQFKAGKTYLISGRLAPQAGQTLLGYGSCIKRCNSASSATSTAISTGQSSVSITVAYASGFRVGMDVTVFNGSSYDPNPHTITAINGNALTVSTSFSVAFPSGGTVVSCTSMIYSNAADVQLIGLEFDGNRDNNTVLARWEIYNAVRLAGARALVRDCYIHDEVSEGMYVGGDGVVIADNHVINCGGNGIHFSGSAGLKCTGNFVKNCNLLGTAPGHADGCIIFSNMTEYAHIIGNYCENGICGVGSIDSDDNSSVVIHGNVIRNCTTTAIEGIVPSLRVGSLSIIGNLIFDSVKIALLNTGGTYTTTSGVYNCVVSGNVLKNTGIEVVAAMSIILSNNVIDMPATTTGYAVGLSNVVGVSVTGNTIVGGMYGISLSGSSSARVAISNNNLLNQYWRAISVTSPHSGVAVSIDSNTIAVESTYTTKSDYGAIVPQNKTTVRGNNINIQATTTQACILCPNGATGVDGAIVQGNVIRHGSGVPYAIRIGGGAQNNFVVGNFVQTAVSNASAATNTVESNYVIAG